MISANTLNRLNRLVVLHNRSLASYLEYAPPSWHRGQQEAKATLSLISAQQGEVVDRLARLITQNDGVVDYGHYPMVYTAFHDLSFEFLLDQLIANQRQILTETEQCAAAITHEAGVYEFVQEALGLAKGHLDSLEELKRPALA